MKFDLSKIPDNNVYVPYQSIMVNGVNLKLTQHTIHWGPDFMGNCSKELQEGDR